MTDIKQPFFSIILPTYNRAHIIELAINSVIDQTFTDWELIVIDDGSKDNTKEKVAGINDPRIRYIYQNNAERCVARNNGINNAKGQFVCFLDSDDRYMPHHLSTIYNEIEKQNFAVGLYVTNVIRLQNEKKTEVPFESAKDHKNPICYVLMAKESVIPARVSVSKRILETEKFDEDRNKLIVSEDMDLFIRILSKFPLFQINNHTVIYYLHDENTTNIKFNPFKVQLKMLRKIFSNKRVKNFIPLNIRNKKLSNCYFGIARFYEFNKKWFPMAYYLSISILYYPNQPITKSKIYSIIMGTKWFISKK